MWPEDVIFPITTLVDFQKSGVHPGVVRDVIKVLGNIENTLHNFTDEMERHFALEARARKYFIVYKKLGNLLTKLSYLIYTALSPILT